MKLTEILNKVPDSDLIRIKEGNKVVYEGYRGMIEEEIEGEVVRISNTTEVWKRKQRYYDRHKGELELVEQVQREDLGQYDFHDLTVKLIMQLNIKK